MELRSGLTQSQEIPMFSSVLQGEGFCINRILSRESSVGQSSRIYCRSAEGIPFKWELQPGTPKEPQEDDIVPPLSPSPLMQNMGLPLPNDQGLPFLLNGSRIRRLKELVKKRISILDVINKDSSFSSGSTSSLSESSFSSNGLVLDSSVVEIPFCCGPWNVPSVLVGAVEDNARVYYCSHHKTTFNVEEDGSFVTRTLSKFPSNDDEQFPSHINNETAAVGVPFRWEMQPGMPKRPLENGVIPPPSPPPAAQNQGLPRPWQPKNKRGVWGRAWNWIRANEKKERGKNESEISFRRHGNNSSCDDETVRIKCYNWSRRDVLAATRKKFKSLTF